MNKLFDNITFIKLYANVRLEKTIISC